MFESGLPPHRMQIESLKGGFFCACVFTTLFVCNADNLRTSEAPFPSMMFIHHPEN